MSKALFLDRDGIVNIDYGYVYKQEDFQFVEGIFELIMLFIQHDYHIFILTNQSGIGRGYYTLTDFNNLTTWMLKIFKEKKIHIEEVFYCPHLPRDYCDCRKPNTGMIKKCLDKHTIDLAHSWLIGDKQSDIDLAHNAHIASSIAIGDYEIKGATLHFDTLLSCKEYLEENQAIISF
ncbi:MAG: D,D-heptose 1,7-bisphosphate phosphatase [Sulfurovum sp.]|nr:MAG: D,D-heptose 1,7-bisphosphate phosphatase [Sulfurovum sp.]RUM74191.1 MAG: D,D-heptose 1,7-bisphosphate phosphatase [Sulfurovum sp.]